MADQQGAEKKERKPRARDGQYYVAIEGEAKAAEGGDERAPLLTLARRVKDKREGEKWIVANTDGVSKYRILFLCGKRYSMRKVETTVLDSSPAPF